MVDEGEEEGLAVVLSGQSIEDNLPTDKNGYTIYPYVRQMVNGIESKAEGMQRKDVCRGRASRASIFTLRCDDSEDASDGGEEGDSGRGRVHPPNASKPAGPGRRGRKFPDAKPIRGGQLGTSRPTFTDEEDGELTELSNSSEADADIDDKSESEDTNIAISDDESVKEAVSPAPPKMPSPDVLVQNTKHVPELNNHRELSGPSLQSSAVSHPSEYATSALESASLPSAPPTPAILERTASIKSTIAESVRPPSTIVPVSIQRSISKEIVVPDAEFVLESFEDEKIKEAEMLQAKRERELREEQERLLEEKRAIARREQLLIDLENRVRQGRWRRRLKLCLNSWNKARISSVRRTRQIRDATRIHRLRRALYLWRETWTNILTRRQKFVSEIKLIAVNPGQIQTNEVLGIKLSYNENSPDIIESIQLSHISDLLGISLRNSHVAPSVLPYLLELRTTFLTSLKDRLQWPCSQKQMWKCGVFSRASLPGHWTPGDCTLLATFRCLLSSATPCCSREVLGLYEGTFSSLSSGELSSNTEVALSFADLCLNSSAVAADGMSVAIVFVKLRSGGEVSFDSLDSYIFHMKNRVAGPLVLILVQGTVDPSERSCCERMPLDLQSSPDRIVSETMKYLTSKLQRTIDLHAAFSLKFNLGNDGISSGFLEESSESLVHILAVAASCSPSNYLIRKAYLLDAIESELIECIWNRKNSSYHETSADLFETINHLNWILDKRYIRYLESMVDFCSHADTTMAGEFSIAQHGTSCIVGALYRDDTGSNSTSLPLKWYDEHALVALKEELNSFFHPSNRASHGECVEELFGRLLRTQSNLDSRLRDQIRNLVERNLWQRALAVFINSKCRESRWSNKCFYILDDVHLNLEPLTYEPTACLPWPVSMKRIKDSRDDRDSKNKRVKTQPELNLPSIEKDSLGRGFLEIVIQFPKVSSLDGKELMSGIEEERRKTREFELYLQSLRDG